MKPSIEQLARALHQSWAADTAFAAEEWSHENPARGQCVVSSLVIQKYLGGELVRYRFEAPDFKETHYCNQLRDGTVLDTTAAQYNAPVTLRVDPVDPGSFGSVRDKRLAETETRERYELLLSRVESHLQN